jgi:glucosamine--fructose-6-phosphate aminotransferase (isomerizing)
MCGIIGYLGPRPPLEVLLEGLKRLEYRGYDSAGIGVFHGQEVVIKRCEGKIRTLEKLLEGMRVSGKVGIGHTRWATHGEPNERNAHPHKSGRVSVVHNGIIENYLSLKEELKGRGRVFHSDTDSEVIAHLIDEGLKNGLEVEEAVRRALERLQGSYAILVLVDGLTDLLIGARKESPLLLGLGEGEYFLSSDAPAIIQWTRDFIFLEDEEIAVIRPEGFRIFDLKGRNKEKRAIRVDWSPTMAEKGGYKHFMLKEIHEQPHVLIDTLRGRINEEEGRVRFEDFPFSDEELERFQRVVLVACGTSWHAGLIGERWLESLAGIEAKAEIGSEFRFRDLLGDERTLLIAISQSGETADTLQAVREGKKKGFRTLGICNVLGSSLTREVEGTLFTRAGPEISVASTKAFLAQLGVLFLLALYLGQKRRRLTEEKVRSFIFELRRLPHLMEEVLRKDGFFQELAKDYYNYTNFLYLGRGISYPVALEGALKLKEISYVHAEGYPGGEMKHGPIALIDEKMPSVVIAPRDHTYEKMLGNIKEIKSRKGKVIALLNQEDPQVQSQVDVTIRVPFTSWLLSPFVTVLPLQLFAYYVADFKGTDVDQPRNLAKSVTVE